MRLIAHPLNYSVVLYMLAALYLIKAASTASCNLNKRPLVCFSILRRSQNQEVTGTPIKLVFNDGSY